MTLGYTRFGSGRRKVIALHGWFGDQTTFDPMRDALSGDDFTYVFPAYRGYGMSRHLTGDYSMKEIAADVLALADTLGWQRFSLIGHSMGGMAVQRVLANAADRVERIVAVTPVPACGVQLPPEAEGLFTSAAASLDSRQMILDFSTGNRLSKTWLANMAKYSWDNCPTEPFGAYLQAWTKTNFVSEIEGNPVPMKAIVGAHDGSLTPDVMKATYLAWYPNSELDVIDNAGHYPMNEAPIALATSMENFLRQ
jgi:pimeloyl-ACP methyl ester carboxylesterase